MSLNKTKKLTVKAVATDVILTMLIFVVLTLIIAIFVNTGAIELKYVNVMMFGITVVSSCVAAVIVRKALSIRYNVALSLVCTVVLAAAVVIAILCQKGSGADKGRIITTLIFIAVGKGIPIVIQNDLNNTKRTKKRKKN